MTRFDATYRTKVPDAAAVASTHGLLLLDFGTDWCGHCIDAREAVTAWLDAHDAIDHLRVEDGRGRPLGRAYRVKLWPTLVLLRDGQELARVVRPRDVRDMQALDVALSASKAQ